ncbi:hypothetical protein [Mycobacterium syngnathidarum]
MANPHASALVANETPYSREEFTTWLTESCERQQVPVTITNPAVLATIAVLLR